MTLQQNILSLRHYDASHGSHTHEHFQILLGLSGVLELEVQGRGQRIAAGQGCVITPGERHDFASRQGSRCLVLDTAQADWAYCTPGPAKTATVQALALYLEQALQQPGSLAQHYGPALLLEAWQPFSAAKAAPVSRHARTPRPINWMQLATWAQQRLHEPLSVAQLAAQVFLSPTQFAMRCRRETGLSVMQWLRQQRLAHAQALRVRGMKLAEAARQCGYQSPSALTAAMRRQWLV
ncbi:AraC family transcriptional regulator [Polaromonas sp. SM01]|uniref:AraC family transcriptional regulator n=1 Tax=Polaromonas sp. SM01 TaxID=3085630 RepID=UPI002981EC05|nr:AraC family transcriptional regulator [Polaromonas sp. SM01]MDW5442600.1 AraC family transcriptional regulator [Polaromonas sp. SM01]